MSIAPSLLEAAKDPLSSAFAALADPTRRAILARLVQGEATVGELAAPFAMSLPSISRHLKVLEHAGLIQAGRSGQQRPRRLETDALRAVDDWMAPFRDFFDTRFDRLERQLANEISIENSTATTTPGTEGTPA